MILILHKKHFLFKKIKVYLFNHLTLQINFFAIVDYSPTVDETGCGFGCMVGHGRAWARAMDTAGGEREQLGVTEARDGHRNIPPP